MAIAKLSGMARAGMLGIAVFAASAAFGEDESTTVEDQPKLSFSQMMTDPEDGKFDVSAFLGRGGFIPLPFVITEPALGKGLGMALAFFDNSGVPNGEDTTISLVGAAGTTNGSQLAFAGRQGSLQGGDIKYRVALGGGSVNLTFFPNIGSTPLEFNNKAWLFFADARKRLGNSQFFLGPSLTLNRSNISPNNDNGTPIPPSLSQTIDQAALGLELTFDSRDNPHTPRNGLSASLSVKSFSPTWGSDSEFVASKLFGAGFFSPDENWTFSAMGLYEGTHGDAPFFMEPSISLRGVPYNRYQGDQVFSTEIEIRRQVDPRWSVLGFAGYGATQASGTSVIGGDFEAFAYGVGFRYRIARKMGMDLGIDYAIGPEANIWYITLGQAWARHMK
ncbi:BamA/TamA family outer membrane protein [uncultured Shimia sp.]|uniref:BamA/TamA family outer membrane protein n=1 Tax=uncultured Shimia sp. TaxID=573152 RepID=UPI002617F23A|nr:BamA/TamA family outer membrane protein [uncultured Shimia sp.]